MVTLKQSSLVNSKSITLDINTEITELVHNKPHKNLETNEANGINHTISKEKEKRIL